MMEMKKESLASAAKRLLFGYQETETETTPGLLIPAGGVAGRGFGGTSMRCADGRRCA